MRKILVGLVNAGCDIPTAVVVVDVLRSNLKTRVELKEAYAYLYACTVVRRKALDGEYVSPPNRDDVSSDFKLAQIEYLEFDG